MDFGEGLHGAHLQGELIARVGRYPVRAALRDGTVRRLWHRVVVDSKRVLDPRTRAAAALLLHGPDAVIAGPTAALLHGCPAIDDGPVHVLVPYGNRSRSRDGLAVHNGPMPAGDVVVRDSLRVLTVERVTSDLLCTAQPRDAIATTDFMLANQPIELREAFRDALAQRLRARRDPRGTRRGALILDLATGRAESPPESWLLLEVTELGFPCPEVNWPILSPSGRELYRLDLAWPQRRIALEYNGYAAHHGRESEDARRADDLRRRGWIVITVTSDDLRDSQRLERLLSEAFERRGFRRSGI
jgi:hypothetical protein